MPWCWLLPYFHLNIKGGRGQASSPTRGMAAVDRWSDKCYSQFSTKCFFVCQLGRRGKWHEFILIRRNQEREIACWSSHETCFRYNPYG